MDIFSEIAHRAEALRGLLGDCGDLAATIEGLGDDDVAAVIGQAGALARAAEKVGIVASGVAARRSSRDAGHSGLAQRRGHRDAVSLVQGLTGATRADAAKQVRLGQSLLEASPALPPTDDESASGEQTVPPEPWHAPLGRALVAGTISSAQHEAILRNLGEPPAVDAATIEAWSLAATQLVEEASQRTVEELRSAARTIRDRLDPDGAERRQSDRFDARAFRLWTDADGIRRGSFVFDDIGAAWVRAIHDTALRPRRGGPRFVDPDEKTRAADLVDDPRTNDQLAYDLMMDVLRAGALADAEAVFGTRQAGVRVVTVVDATRTDAPAATHVEDTGEIVPPWVAAAHACDAPTVDGAVDRRGDPLYLGREARLFSPRQRLMLAIRDGGCRWRGCDRPASYCEAHHIDGYAQGGTTDIDRGILLCRFHHMQLHHGGWRITRDGAGDFVLHPPPGRGSPTVLRPRLALRYAWGGVDPPPKRFRPAKRFGPATPSLRP